MVAFSNTVIKDKLIRSLTEAEAVECRAALPSRLEASLRKYPQVRVKPYHKGPHR